MPEYTEDSFNAAHRIYTEDLCNCLQDRPFLGKKYRGLEEKLMEYVKLFWGKKGTDEVVEVAIGTVQEKDPRRAGNLAISIVNLPTSGTRVAIKAGIKCSEMATKETDPVLKGELLQAALASGMPEVAESAYTHAEKLFEGKGTRVCAFRLFNAVALRGCGGHKLMAGLRLQDMSEQVGMPPDDFIRKINVNNYEK